MKLKRCVLIVLVLVCVLPLAHAAEEAHFLSSSKLGKLLWKGFYKTYTFLSGGITGNVVAADISTNQFPEPPLQIVPDLDTQMTLDDSHNDAAPVAVGPDEDLERLMGITRKLMADTSNVAAVHPAEEKELLVAKLQNTIRRLS